MQIGLLRMMLLLFGVAIASTILLGPLGLDAQGDKGLDVGLACGLVSCGIAAWTPRRHATRIVSALVLGLSLAAIVLAGPYAAFMLAFGLMTGLGSVFALLGAGGETGTEAVGMTALWSLSIAVATVLGFASQAWAVLRGLACWKPV
jgi:hypothetical protein